MKILSTIFSLLILILFINNYYENIGFLTQEISGLSSTNKLILADKNADIDSNIAKARYSNSIKLPPPASFTWPFPLPKPGTPPPPTVPKMAERKILIQNNM